MASLDVGLEGSSIVTTDFVDTSAEGGATVILAGDDIGIGLEAALEVRSHGSDKDEEEVLVGGLHTHGDAGTDKQGSQIEAGTSAIGRNELLVHLDDLLAHLDKLLGGEFGHHDATAGALQTLGVGFGTEDTDFAILATVGFQTLKGFLAIMEARSSHVHLDMLGTGNFNLTPLAVAEVAAYIVVRFYVTKRKVLPIYVHVYQFIVIDVD